MMSHPYQFEVKTAQEAAISAGRVALSLKSTSSHTQKTGGNGPVSEADLKADALICAVLRSTFPNDLVISEEAVDESTTVPNTGRVWLVDPIDGTMDFIQGGSDYSVMIGLLIDAKPRVGVIYEPETSSLWTGVLWDSEGVEKRIATKTDRDGVVKKLDISEIQEIFRDPTVVKSKNHPSLLADQIIQSLSPKSVLKKGSLGLKVAMIAEQKADLYIAASKRIKVWDTCAPWALLTACGGEMLDFNGKKLEFSPGLTHKTPFFSASARYLKTAIKNITNTPI